MGKLVCDDHLAFSNIIYAKYQPSGLDQCKDFSSGIGMESFAYIPQLEVPSLGFPLLACNIDDIDVRLIGWKDPNRSDENEHHRYDSRNIIFDVANEKLHRSRFGTIEQSCDRKSDRPIFSVVKHYPPKWAVRGNSEGESNQTMENE